MTKLHEITKQHRELELLAEQGEIPAEAIADTFEAIEGSFSEKAASLIQVVNNMDTEVIDAELKRLQAMKKAIVNRKESLKNYLRTNMELSGIKKIECPLFTITLTAGRKMAIVDDENKLPDEYVDVQVVTKPNKALILAQLKEGKVIPGAHIETSKTGLRIK